MKMPLGMVELPAAIMATTVSRVELKRSAKMRGSYLSGQPCQGGSPVRKNPRKVAALISHHTHEHTPPRHIPDAYINSPSGHLNKQITI